MKNSIIKLWTAVVAATLAGSSAIAAPGYPLPQSGQTGILGNIQTWLTSLVAFVTGPAAVAIAVLAFIGAAAMWVFAPRGGAIGVAMRAIAATIVVFNLAALVAWFTV